MKVGMGLAYCYTAYQIAGRAPAKTRTYTALVALLVPVGLFELAGGYRELFATALAVTSLATAVSRRLVFSTILSVAAASISEEFLPLTLLAAAVALTSSQALGARFRTAVTLAAIATLLFIAEWQILIPHDIAAHALGYRFGPAPLGGRFVGRSTAVSERVARVAAGPLAYLWRRCTVSSCWTPNNSLVEDSL